ncbi:mandelate racemase/muconate lactonizing enzyme family protein [Galbibacter mesophilus]|uniref:mandelate racemase/muconate lactonizing enzyme family protein n=1 Tax=Galbibacter mesophilus TaxID=379069 RepID=UPI00191D03CE|nr:mandelate racemase/muconate lactonizing enzyme family protein [Galbibacter mesophilus]MCM5663130.1 mandelate racemase/muconate lactonizing enzyme family protein [Galbibacter mesophilus]
MKNTRRNFVKNTLAAGVGVSFLNSCNTAPTETKNTYPDYTDLDEALKKPVLKKQLFKDQVIIESCELLEYNGNYMCRVRSQEGAEGYCVGHNIRMPHLYPMQTQRINPFFVGKDARDLDKLVEDVLLFQNNYKYQGYTLWIPLATVEMAILDMLGHIAKKSTGELIGDIHHTDIAIYQANNNRGKSAEESIENIKKLQQETNAKAVKFKIGGRRNIPEHPAGRTEKLIPLMRKNFGEDIAIYADCNGSYEAEEAIRIGKLLENNEIDLFEQPVPTDYYEDWKRVAENLTIPIGSGGGEVSIRNFRWLIATNSVHMVQQDLFYFGGMIRSMKVARMAAAKGLVCTPHISGTGLGYLYMMQFVSVLPNAGPYHEFKGISTNIPFECNTSTLVPKDGKIKLPTGYGNGVTIDPDFIKKHRIITA